MKTIYDFIEAKDYLEEENSYHPDLRRLAYLMKLREFRYDKESQTLRASSLLQESLKIPNKRDALLKLGCLSPQFSLMSAFES